MSMPQRYPRIRPARSAGHSRRRGAEAIEAVVQGNQPTQTHDNHQVRKMEEAEGRQQAPRQGTPQERQRENDEDRTLGAASALAGQEG